MSSICDQERAAVERRLTELKANLSTLDDELNATANRNNRLRELLRGVRELRAVLNRDLSAQ